MKHIKASILTSIAAAVLGMCSFSALANNLQDQLNGITLHSTRLVYPHDAKNGVTYTITNNTSTPYLLQARLIPWKENSSAIEPLPDDGEDTEVSAESNATVFIALPPLQRFEAGETLTLRIRQKHNLLTQDKESISVLALTAIPAQSTDKTKADGAQLTMAVQNNLKLFYRPAGLPEYDLDKVQAQLQLRRTSTGLLIKNPTPFYVTFNMLSVGKTAIDLSQTRMIAPFSEAQWPLENSSVANDVHWQLITDNGNSSEAITRQLTPKQ